MQTHYYLLRFIIITELFLVIAIILLTYILKLFYAMKEERNESIMRRIAKYIDELLTGKINLTLKSFPIKGNRRALLLPVIYQFDAKTDSSEWPELKKSLAQLILLPLARERYDSYFWKKRLFAAQSFELALEEQDEDKLCALIEDKIPLIHLYASIAAIKYGSKKLINHVINIASKKRRLGQAVYSKIFQMSDVYVGEVVAERLITEKDPYIRTTCYNILLSFPKIKFQFQTSEDIHSENIELTLAALRYTAYVHKTDAIPLLLELLFDPRWEVRAISVRLLGDLNAVETIPEIKKCLNDTVWWVKVNATNALKKLSDEQAQGSYKSYPHIDSYTYENALKMLDKKTTPKEGDGQ